MSNMFRNKHLSLKGTVQNKNFPCQRRLGMVETVAPDTMISVKQKFLVVSTKMKEARKIRPGSITIETCSAGRCTQKHKGRESPGRGWGGVGGLHLLEGCSVWFLALASETGVSDFHINQGVLFHTCALGTHHALW